MSSGFYFAALIPFIKNRKKRKLLCAASGIGIGSILLHGTGRFYGQWIDEFSILMFFQFILEDYDKNHPKKLRYLLLSYFIFWKRFYFFFGIFSMYYIRLCWLMRKQRKFLFISSFSGLIWFLEQQRIVDLKKYNLHVFWHLGTSLAIHRLLLKDKKN